MSREGRGERGNEVQVGKGIMRSGVWGGEANCVCVCGAGGGRESRRMR